MKSGHYFLAMGLCFIVIVMLVLGFLSLNDTFEIETTPGGENCNICEELKNLKKLYE